MDVGAENAGSDEVPRYARLRNGVRIVLQDSCKKEKGLIFVVQEVLLKTLKLQKEEVLAMLEFPRQGIYDIVLTTEEACNSLWGKVERCKTDPVWNGVSIIPHFPKKRRLITVRMYSPYVPEGEIMCFLSRYCEDVKPMGKVLNQFGLWTMKRRFVVDFRENTKGELIIPPSRFKIGSINGDLFFAGMPPFCRKCRRYGHEMDSCNIVRCTSCEQEGHMAARCPGGKVCNMCGGTGHFHASCPKKENKKDQAQARPGKEPEKRSEKEEKRKPEKEKEAEIRRKVVVTPEKIQEKREMKPAEMKAPEKKAPEKKVPEKIAVPEKEVQVVEMKSESEDSEEEAEEASGELSEKEKRRRYMKLMDRRLEEMVKAGEHPEVYKSKLLCYILGSRGRFCETYKVHQYDREEMDKAYAKKEWSDDLFLRLAYYAWKGGMKFY